MLNFVSNLLFPYRPLEEIFNKFPQIKSIQIEDKISMGEVYSCYLIGINDTKFIHESKIINLENYDDNNFKHYKEKFQIKSYSIQFDLKENDFSFVLQKLSQYNKNTNTVRGIGFKEQTIKRSITQDNASSTPISKEPIYQKRRQKWILMKLQNIY